MFIFIQKCLVLKILFFFFSLNESFKIKYPTSADLQMNYNVIISDAIFFVRIQKKTNLLWYYKPQAQTTILSS